MSKKPQFTFGFIDEPQFRCRDTRAHVAHLLRAYRANPRRYQLTRIPNGYRVHQVLFTATAEILREVNHHA
ncbi:UNVERIFIED_CONTAM: hypothetical protein [Bacteriophage sp.]